VSLKEIAVDGCTLTITTAGVNGTISIVSVPSTKVKAEDKGVYSGDMQLMITGITGIPPAGSSSPGTASCSISPTATSVKAEGQLVCRVGDKVQNVSAVGATEPNPPPPGNTKPSTIIFDVEITDAGQTKVTAE
jgi:hypothetical protein